LKRLETKQIKEDDLLWYHIQERNQEEIFRREKSSRNIMNFVLLVDTWVFLLIIKKRFN